ncbi:hypothetical protein Tco_0158583 [Tanacetum coccineum]
MMNDDDGVFFCNIKKYLMTSSAAITPDSPKTDSLIMVDKHLDTFRKQESTISLSLVLRTLSKTQPSPRISSRMNVDASIISSPKIESLLEQFSDELAHIDPIPPGIEEADFDLEEEIRLVENDVKFNRVSFRETPKVLIQAWDKFLEIKHAQSEEVQELLSKLLQDLQSINEELAEYINTLSWNFPTSSYDDDDDEYSFATQEYLMTSSTTITPDSSKTHSLIMVDKHLDTIPETESDEFIKYSVENLVQNPSKSEYFSEDECECDVPDCDDSQTTNFSTFSNPLFDDSTSSDDESFSDEDIDSLLEQFSDELAHIDPIPPGIEEADFDLEKEIRLVENLSYDNSSPRPPEERNSENVDTIIESPSPSPIPVVDSDSHMEDSEGDIYFLEELLSNDPLPLPEIESSNLDHFNDLSSPRPPPEPPDVEICFDVELDTTMKNDFDELNEDECFDPEGERNSENVDMIIESPSPSPIPVEDSDFHMKEIDLFLTSDDSMPPGIENYDYDSEGDIRFLKELLSNDPFPLSRIDPHLNLIHFNDRHPPLSSGTTKMLRILL